jgi:predicted regulator of Ras-like GTPase activity (Roadblock/LC7/MglB family)
MDAGQALSDLTQVSTQIDGAVLAQPGGKILASTYEDAKGERVAKAALELLRAADEAREGAELTQVLAATASGAVFVVRGDKHVAAAVTAPEPIAGLIFYDLKTCLRLLENEQGKAKKTTTRRKKPAKKDEDA